MDQQPAYYLKKLLKTCSLMLLLSASHVILAANANNIAAERDTETDSDTIKPDTIKLGTIKLDTIKSGVIKPSTIKSGTIKSVEPVSTTKFILPPDHQSRYSINKFDSHVGDMHNTLKQTGNQVKYTSKTKATGFASLFVKNDVNEISRLNWFESNSERTLRQQNYQLLRGKKHKKNQTISFDWSSIKDNSTNDNLTNKDLNNVKINGSYKNRTYEFVTEQPVWSRHFLPLLMSNELLSSEGKQTDTFHITDKGSSQKYAYTLEKTENLFLSGKSYPVLKYRISREGSSRMSYTWISKAHYYLPLKIEQYKDNELNVSMLMTEFRLTQDAKLETNQEPKQEAEQDDYE